MNPGQVLPTDKTSGFGTCIDGGMNITHFTRCFSASLYIVRCETCIIPPLLTHSPRTGCSYCTTFGRVIYAFAELRYTFSIVNVELSEQTCYLVMLERFIAAMGI